MLTQPREAPHSHYYKSPSQGNFYNLSATDFSSPHLMFQIFMAFAIFGKIPYFLIIYNQFTKVEIEKWTPNVSIHTGQQKLPTQTKVEKTILVTVLRTFSKVEKNCLLYPLLGTIFDRFYCSYSVLTKCPSWQVIHCPHLTYTHFFIRTCIAATEDC